MDLFQSLVTALMIKELELLCFSDIFCICIECLTSWQLGIRVCSGLQHSSFSDLSTPPPSILLFSALQHPGTGKGGGVQGGAWGDAPLHASTLAHCYYIDITLHS